MFTFRLHARSSEAASSRTRPSPRTPFASAAPNATSGPQPSVASAALGDAGGDGINASAPPPPSPPPSGRQAPPSPTFLLRSGSTRGIMHTGLGPRDDCGSAHARRTSGNVSNRGCVRKRGSSDFGGLAVWQGRPLRGLPGSDAAAFESSGPVHSCTGAERFPVPSCQEAITTLPAPSPAMPVAVAPPQAPSRAASMTSAGVRTSDPQHLLSSVPSSCGTGFGATSRTTSKSGTWQRSSNASSYAAFLGVGVGASHRTSRTWSYVNGARDSHWGGEDAPATPIIAAGDGIVANSAVTYVASTAAAGVAATASTSGRAPAWRLPTAMDLPALPANGALGAVAADEDRQGGGPLAAGAPSVDASTAQASERGGGGGGSTGSLGEPGAVLAGGEPPGEAGAAQGPRSAMSCSANETDGAGSSIGRREPQQLQPQPPWLSTKQLDPRIVQEVDSADELLCISFKLPCPSAQAAAAAITAAASAALEASGGTGADIAAPTALATSPVVSAPPSMQAELPAAGATAPVSVSAPGSVVLAPGAGIVEPETHTVPSERVMEPPGMEARGGKAPGELSAGCSADGASKGSGLRRWLWCLADRAKQRKRRGRVGPAAVTQRPAAAHQLQVQPAPAAIRCADIFGRIRISLDARMTSGSLKDGDRGGRAVPSAGCSLHRRESHPSGWLLGVRPLATSASEAVPHHKREDRGLGDVSGAQQVGPLADPAAATAVCGATDVDEYSTQRPPRRRTSSRTSRLLSVISNLGGGGCGRAAGTGPVVGPGAGIGRSSRRSAAFFLRITSSSGTQRFAAPVSSLTGQSTAGPSPSPGLSSCLDNPSVGSGAFGRAADPAAAPAAGPAAAPAATADETDDGGSGAAAPRSAAGAVSGGQPRGCRERGCGVGSAARGASTGSFLRRCKSLKSLLLLLLLRRPLQTPPSTPPHPHGHSRWERQPQQSRRRPEALSASGVGRLPALSGGGIGGADASLRSRRRPAAGAEAGGGGGLRGWGGGTQGRREGDWPQRTAAHARLALLAPLAAAVLSPPGFEG